MKTIKDYLVVSFLFISSTPLTRLVYLLPFKFLVMFSGAFVYFEKNH